MEISDLRRASRSLPDYLEEAEKLSSQDRFKEAWKNLFDALKLPGLTADEEIRIQAEQEKSEDLLRQRLSELTRSVEAQLRMAPDEVAKADLEAGQAALASLRDLFVELPEEVPDPADLEERWRAFRRRAETLLGLKEVRLELEKLWQEPYFTSASYDRALTLARQQAKEFPEEPLAHEMLSEAESKRKDAAEREGILTTAETMGDLNKVKAELEHLEKEGLSELPWYEWGLKQRDSEGRRVRSLLRKHGVPAAQALERVVELARQYEDDKASQYLGEAEVGLAAQPEAAAESVKRAQAFEYLSPRVREELSRFFENEVRPALERRQRATDLSHAALAPGKPVEEAWGELAAAEAIDSFAPEIGHSRDELRPRFAKLLEGELRKAEETCEAGDFDEAAERVSLVLERIGDYEPFANLAQQARSLNQKCLADRRLFETVGTQSVSILELAKSDLPAAVEALADLEARIGDRPESFQRLLLGARSAVRAQQSVAVLVVEWESRLRRLDPTRLEENESLQVVLDDLNRLEKEVDEERGRRGSVAELQGVFKRIDLRRRLVEGRRDWKAGLYERATAAWRRVAQAGENEDASLAGEWLARAEDDTAVAQALDQARSYCREEKRFREALEVLSRWRTEASSRSQEVQALYRDIQREWASELNTEIQELIANLAKRPAYALLVERIEALEPLQPEKARRYRQEHLAPIYEEWGDRELASLQYEQAEQYYRQAATLASGAQRLQVDGKLQLLRRQQNDSQIESLWAEGKRSEARERLASWLRLQDPNHAPGFVWLAELFLEEEQTEQAGIYLQQLEHRLDAAERTGDPARAGLRAIEEIAEWRSLLGILRDKTRAIVEIREGKGQITEWLSPTSSIREYRRAKGACEQLIVRLTAFRRELAEPEPLAEGEDPSLPQEADRVQVARQKAQRWLDEQLRPATGLRAWFNNAERELLARLREDWGQSAAPELDSLDFREATPSSELLGRWNVGLKIRFLFSDSTEGEKALLELSEAQRRLGRAVRELTQNPRGPDHGLAQESLDPRTALEVQLQWGDRLQSWAAVLSDLLGNYAWAAGNRSAEDRAAGTSEDESTAQGSYQEIRAIKAQSEEFQRALFDLTGAIREAEARLDRAVSAGHDGQVRWEHVPWEDLVISVLRSPKMPLPTADGRDLARTYWSALEADDPGTRLEAWRKAADVVGARGAVSESLGSVSYEIDSALRQAGLEEGWEDVDAALKEHLVRFDQHRTVAWIRRRRDAARKRRDQLVEMRILLATLVNAEEFSRALQQMERMKKLDREDAYGFRSGEVANVPEPLGWEPWRAWLDERKRQLEVFGAWRAVREGDTFSLWQESKRGELLGFMRQARFDEAERLGRDVLDGDEEGRTLQSGGGLALQPLLGHLEAVPPELEPALSQRLQQNLAEIARQRRLVKEAVGELRFWLEGAGGPGPADLDQTIAARRSAFRNQVDQVKGALQALQFPGRLTSWWWRRRPKSKEAQHLYCRQAWEELRRLAPEWPELDVHRRAIEEA